jgi:hypothetical protein
MGHGKEMKKPTGRNTVGCKFFQSGAMNCVKAKDPYFTGNNDR